MHNFVGMAVGHGRKKLFHVYFSLVLRDSLLLYNPFKKLSSAAILHYDVYKGLLDVNVVNPNDIGVILKIIRMKKILAF